MVKTFRYRALIISIEDKCDPHAKESEFYWQVKRLDGTILDDSDFGFESDNEAMDSAKEFIDDWYR